MGRHANRRRRPANATTAPRARKGMAHSKGWHHQWPLFAQPSWPPDNRWRVRPGHDGLDRGARRLEARRRNRGIGPIVHHSPPAPPRSPLHGSVTCQRANTAGPATIAGPICALHRGKQSWSATIAATANSSRAQCAIRPSARWANMTLPAACATIWPQGRWRSLKPLHV
jgi:hypothetical protein